MWTTQKSWKSMKGAATTQPRRGQRAQREQRNRGLRTSCGYIESTSCALHPVGSDGYNLKQTERSKTTHPKQCRYYQSNFLKKRHVAGFRLGISIGLSSRVSIDRHQVQISGGRPERMARLFAHPATTTCSPLCSFEENQPFQWS